MVPQAGVATVVAMNVDGEASVTGDPIVPAMSRRTVLGRIIQGLGLSLALGPAIPVVQARERATESDETDRLIVRVARPLDAETPVQEFASYLTPTSRFFVRSHFGPPPPEQLSDENWRLRVTGLVDRPLTLTLRDLKQFEVVTITAVVQCSGNGRASYRPKVPGVQWERGAVGHARWTGVRLRDVLAKAGLQTNGLHVQFQGADRPVAATVPLFVRSIPIEKALHQDTILAYEMNGRSLPLLHGAPLRVVTPGWMADSCIKWLTDITVQQDEAQGYYMQTAYRYPARPVTPGEVIASSDLKPVETMVVKSLIAQPREGATLKPGPVTIQGVAWTGEGRIVRVEVSIDEGRTWEPARLIGEEQPYAWRQWQYIWQSTSGLKTILCRATDDRGVTQPETSPWNPSGFLWNGWDHVIVAVAG
ncbi:MAG: sulfite oxidase [Nitrospirae bacterium]|nr:sulfite oxidase [Nitrospirota bacterium]